MIIDIVNLKTLLLLVVIIDIAAMVVAVLIEYTSLMVFNVVKIYLRKKIINKLKMNIYISNLTFKNPKINGIDENGLRMDFIYYNGNKWVGVKIIDYKRWNLGPMVARIVEIHIATLLANLFADLKRRRAKTLQRNETLTEQASFIGFCIPVMVDLNGISIIRSNKKSNVDDVISEIREVINNSANYKDIFLDFLATSSTSKEKYWYNNDKAT